MLLTLDSFPLDTHNSLEREFLEWYDVNRSLTKQVVLSGYFYIQNGVHRYLEEHIANEEARDWRNKYESAVKELTSRTKEIEQLERRFADFTGTIESAQVAALRSSYDARTKVIEDERKAEVDRYRSLIDTIRKEHDTEVEAQKKSIDSLNLELQKVLEAKVANVVAEKEAEVTKYQHALQALQSELSGKYEAQIRMLTTMHNDEAQRYERTVSAMQADVDRLVRELDTFKQTAAQIQDRTRIEEGTRFNETAEVLRKELGEKDKVIQSLNDTIGTLVEQHREANRIARCEFEQTVSQMSEIRSREYAALGELQKKLEKDNEYLKTQLKDNQVVLEAMYRSMITQKDQDISNLQHQLNSKVKVCDELQQKLSDVIDARNNLVHQQFQDSQKHTETEFRQLKEYIETLKTLYHEEGVDELLQAIHKTNESVVLYFKSTEQKLVDSVTSVIQQQYEHKLALEQNNFAAKLDNMKLQYESSANLTVAEVKAERDRFMQMYMDAKTLWQNENTQAIKQQHEEQVKKLQCVIHELQAELTIAKKSNMGKGNIGEHALSEWLRNNYIEFDVQDTSKLKAACDIHVAVNSKEFFAIESKNKSTITRNDIDKFYRDVQNLTELNSNAFLGAMFVSLATKNVPGKGDFYFELFQNRPVLFIGFNIVDNLNSDFMKRCISLLLQAAQSCKVLGEQATSVQDMHTKLAPMILKIQRIRKEVDSVKEMAGNIIKSVDNMQDEANEVVTVMSSVLGNVVLHDVTEKQGVECAVCKKSFLTQAKLDSHTRLSKKCSRRPT